MDKDDPPSGSPPSGALLRQNGSDVLIGSARWLGGGQMLLIRGLDSNQNPYAPEHSGENETRVLSAETNEYKRFRQGKGKGKRQHNMPD